MNDVKVQSISINTESPPRRLAKQSDASGSAAIEPDEKPINMDLRVHLLNGYIHSNVNALPFYCFLFSVHGMSWYNHTINRKGRMML